MQYLSLRELKFEKGEVEFSLLDKYVLLDMVSDEQKKLIRQHCDPAEQNDFLRVRNGNLFSELVRVEGEIRDLRVVIGREEKRLKELEGMIHKKELQKRY